MSGSTSKDEITLLIDQARNGDATAEQELCEKVFQELHNIAKRLLPRADGSMQATVLVHELWLKLFKKDGLKKTENRRYFFTVAADQMRKILIDRYRKKKQKKRGGDRAREPFDVVIDQAIAEFESKNDFDFEALNNALEQMKSNNYSNYQVVMHRFFAGLTIEKTAKALGVSEKTVEYRWRLARVRLLSQLNEQSN